MPKKRRNRESAYDLLMSVIIECVRCWQHEIFATGDNISRSHWMQV